MHRQKQLGGKFQADPFLLKWLGLTGLGVLLFWGLSILVWVYRFSIANVTLFLMMGGLALFIPFVLVIWGQAYLLRPFLPRARNWFWATATGWLGGIVLGALLASGFLHFFIRSTIRPSGSITESELFSIFVIVLSGVLARLLSAFVQYLVLQSFTIKARRWVFISVTAFMLALLLLCLSYFMSPNSIGLHFVLVTLIPPFLTFVSGRTLSRLLNISTDTQIQQRVEQYVASSS